MADKGDIQQRSSLRTDLTGVAVRRAGAEEEEIDVTCEFCRRSYPFDRDDLTRLLAEM